MSDTLPLLRLLAGQLRAGLSEADRHRWALVVDGIADGMIAGLDSAKQRALEASRSRDRSVARNFNMEPAQRAFMEKAPEGDDPQPVRYYRAEQQRTDGTWIDKCSCGWMPKPGEKVVMVGGKLACPVCLAKDPPTQKWTPRPWEERGEG